MKKIRILAADDHPGFRQGLARLLEEEPDLEVVALAENGEEAVKYARKLMPDVAILDIAMPHLNGLEAARQIQTDRPETAVLLLSAYCYQPYVLDALRAGVRGYLSKSVPLPELVSAVRTVNAGIVVYDLEAIGQIIPRISSTTVREANRKGALHPREMEVLKLVAQGLRDQEIAEEMGISQKMVGYYLANACNKLKAGSRTRAALQALKEGWVSLDDLEPANPAK